MSSFYGDPSTPAWQAAKILDVLQGRSSLYPMPFDELHAASGLSKKRLNEMLDAMAYAIPASINRATITKNGVTQVVLWPTCVMQARTRQSIVITKPRAKSRPSKQMGYLTKTLLNRVNELGKVTRNDLMAYGLTLADATEGKVKNSLNVLVSNNRIISDYGRKATIYNSFGVAA